MTYSVTLIVNPEQGPLDVALVDSLRNAWGGGDINWLSVDESADFDIPARSDTEGQAWRDLQTTGVDMVVQPTIGRRKSMLIADMDSTMIRQECIDELAAEAGVGDKVAKITARAMNGELDFEAAIIERVGLLADLDLAVIDQVLNTRISYMSGGYALVQTMKANGGYAALVSGGFTAFTARVAGALGFDEHRANTLIVDGDKLSGDVGRPILGQNAKLESLHQITAKLGITPQDALAVGDGMNDLLMLEAAGTGVALHGKPALQAKCEAKINYADLSALLFIQGYRRDEFVT